MNYSTETINLFLLKNIETKYLIKIVLLLIELINIYLDSFIENTIQCFNSCRYMMLLFISYL
jgi:hypothetical protein